METLRKEKENPIKATGHARQAGTQADEGETACERYRGGIYCEGDAGEKRLNSETMWERVASLTAIQGCMFRWVDIVVVLSFNL